MAEKDDPFGFLAGTDPVDEDEEQDQPEAQAEPEESTDDADGADDDEPEESDEEEPEESEEPLAAEAKPDSKDEDDELERERKKSEGLRQALIEQRRQNRELQSQRAQMANQAPNPATYGMPPQAPQGAPQQAPQGVPAPANQAPPPGYQIEVAPDGSSVWVPKEAIQQDIRQTFAEYQDQFNRQQTQAMTQAFVARDVESRQPIVAEAQAADEFVSLRLENLLMSGEIAVNPNDPNLAQTLVHQLEAAGVVDQVQQFFPHVGAHFERFFEAWGSSNPYGKMSVLEEMAAASGQPARRRSSETPVKPIRNTPQSMARKGGARNESESDDEREFRSLFSRFVNAPERFSAKEKARMEQLGKKLGKESFEDE